MGKKFDFSGWATKNDLRCSDGRTIRHGAFKDQDGQTVPLVWQHQHNDPRNVLGHALLENRDSGVYAYCTFNDTEFGQNAKQLVEHGDVTALSIYANQLKQNGGDVLHGSIKEVSLVLAGANPGALIDFLSMAHGDEEEIDEAVIYTGETVVLEHGSADDDEKKDDELEHAKEPAEDAEETEEGKDTKMADNKEKTVQEVFDELTEEQKNVVYFMIGEALKEAEGKGEEAEHDDLDGGNDFMAHNIFENDNNVEVLTHDDMTAILDDAKRYGSLKDSVMAHTDDYGITNIDYYKPDEKAIGAPDFIKREDSWVSALMNNVHRTPFSRVKSLHANITADEARAKGYVKGNLKLEEVIVALKRTTTPTTVYKKQKLDRDDILDITDFDVVSWIKGEMRGMLDEEIGRAVLVGDGRSASDDDKISETNIRPVWTDTDVYTIKQVVVFDNSDTDDQKAKKLIKAAVKARVNYKGSGNPIFFTTEALLTDMLLMEDAMGHVIYDTEAKLATALRVSKIVTVPVMEGLTRTSGSDTLTLQALIFNPADYNIGADKGGAVNMFDDFDIDYNQQKYLIETRCSGALIKPFSAIAIESK